MKLSIVIPALNEEEGIGAVLSQVPTKELNSMGYEVEVIVVDNNSTDNTASIARKYGAKVVFERTPGYGAAYKAGFTNATGDIIATGDADSTYPLDHLPQLLTFFTTKNIDFLNTNRLQTLKKESMTTWHVFGNWVLTTISKFLYWGVPFGDSQSGMWIFKRSIWDALEVQSDGMPFSQELKFEAYWKGFKCAETPIEYRPRLGEVKLRGMRDAWANMSHLYTKRLVIKRRKGARVQRIAFVIDAVMPYQNGGREKRLFEVSRRMVSPAREIHIYTMKWWKGSEQVIVRDGIYFHALCALHPLYVNDRRSITQALIFGLATFKMLFERFDVLDVDQMPFFPLFSARIVTWLRGKKLYATWHEIWGKEYWMEYLKGPAGIFGHVIERLAFLMPNVIISNSTHTTQKLRKEGVRKEIKTIPLGVDLHDVYQATATKKSDVLFVGRLLSHKNADMLVRAIAIVKNSIPSIKAIIVGDGPEKSLIEGLIQELGLSSNISIIAQVEANKDIYSLMKASKMLVLPSVREGFGLVAIEANAAGIPVITTSHQDNAAKDIIRDGVNGFVVDATQEHIALKIIEILEATHQMNPTHEIEQYDWKLVVQKLEQAFA